MRLIALMFVMSAAVLPFAAAPAQAQTYPWCAVYGGGQDGGGTNCGFSTWEQCRAAISGAGGLCQQNPEYFGEPKRSRRTR